MEPNRERIEDFMQRPRANVLDVVVGTIATDTPFATYRLGISGPMSKVVVTGSRGDGYEGVVRGMLRALAVLGFRGEVRVRYLSDLDCLAATLEITDEYAEQVKAEVGHAWVEQPERAEPHPGTAGAQEGTQRQQAQRPREGVEHDASTLRERTKDVEGRRPGGGVGGLGDETSSVQEEG